MQILWIKFVSVMCSDSLWCCMEHSILGWRASHCMNVSTVCLTVLICVTVGSSAARVFALSPVCRGTHDACSHSGRQPGNGTHAHRVRLSPNHSSRCRHSVSHTGRHNCSTSHCHKVTQQVIAGQWQQWSVAMQLWQFHWMMYKAACNVIAHYFISDLSVPIICSRTISGGQVAVGYLS